MDIKICRICGKNDIDHKYTGRVINDFKIYQCTYCGTYMVLTTQINNSNLYDELFAAGDYEMHRKLFEALSHGINPLQYHRQQILKIVEKKTKGRSLIEIGGGVGAFGLFSKKRGWKYEDYDISAVALEYATKLGLNAHLIQNGLVDLPKTDVVALWEVIEHIPNVNEYLRGIKNSLGENGFLILSTPNYLRRGYRVTDNWGKLASPPLHVNYFTQESLTITLNEAGFTNVRIMKPRFYRPSLSFSSIIYSLQIMLGIEPTKTLFVVATGKGHQ